MFKVLITETVAKEGIQYLEQKGYIVKIGRGTDKAALLEDIQDCDAVLVRVAKIDKEVFDKAPNLKVVAKHGVGVDNIDLEAAKKHDCRVVYTPIANLVSVAEHTIALMCAGAKQILLKTREYAKGNFGIKDTSFDTEIFGKTVGLIGAGKIAREVAHIAKHGFRMRVLAFDPFVPADSLGDLLELTDRENVLKESDFVSIHMPSTKETKKSFSEKEFAMMKKSAWLINTARGAIVDEEALIKALRNGEIAGAALDVTDPEPVARDTSLFTFDNVILTPHCAGCTAESMVRMGTDSAQGIDEVLSGKEPTYAYPGA